MSYVESIRSTGPSGALAVRFSGTPQEATADFCDRAGAPCPYFRRAFPTCTGAQPSRDSLTGQQKTLAIIRNFGTQVPLATIPPDANCAK